MEEVGYLSPTNVQLQALPILFSGRDCLLHAQVKMFICLPVFCGLNWLIIIAKELEEGKFLIDFFSSSLDWSNHMTNHYFMPLFLKNKHKWVLPCFPYPINFLAGTDVNLSISLCFGFVSYDSEKFHSLCI